MEPFIQLFCETTNRIEINYSVNFMDEMVKSWEEKMKLKRKGIKSKDKSEKSGELFI